MRLQVMKTRVLGSHDCSEKWRSSCLFRLADDLMSIRYPVQHVMLRLQSKPYLDHHIWEMILRRTDWITCLRLNHVRIAAELVPCDEAAQVDLDQAVASGDIQLVSRMLQIFSGFPNLDIAAEADQFEMLKFLDSMDRAGTCVCVATGRMAVYAAINSNLAMLDWLINTRLEVDGKGVLAAAVELGNIHIISWIFEQDRLFSIAYIGTSQSEDCLDKALQTGRVDIAKFLIDHFSMQSVACEHAASHSSLAVLQQMLPICAKWMDDNCWFSTIVEALKRGSTEILASILGFIQEKKSSRCPKRPLLSMAAKHSSTKLLEILATAFPEDLEKSDLVSSAMAAAICKGDSEMVKSTFLLAYFPPSIWDLYHGSTRWTPVGSYSQTGSALWLVVGISSSWRSESTIILTPPFQPAVVIGESFLEWIEMEGRRRC